MYPSLVRAKFYLQRSVDSCCDLAGYDKLSSSSYLLFFGGVRGRGERDLDFHHPLSPLFNITVLQYFADTTVFYILRCFFCASFFSSSCFFFLHYFYIVFFIIITFFIITQYYYYYVLLECITTTVYYIIKENDDEEEKNNPSASYHYDADSLQIIYIILTSIADCTYIICILHVWPLLSSPSSNSVLFKDESTLSCSKINFHRHLLMATEFSQDVNAVDQTLTIQRRRRAVIKSSLWLSDDEYVLYYL